MTININGIDKAKLLAALVNSGRPMGLGFLHAGHMTEAEAQEWIDSCRPHDLAGSGGARLYFDYVKGVPVKSDLSGDELDPRLYDRDQGEGAAARVVAQLRGEP